jgi:CHC2 zinc finger
VTPLEQAKELLPLPALLSRLGLGEHAKKSSRCPFHDDSNNSFSVFQNEKGEWGWNCFGQCGCGGDEPAFIAKRDNIENDEACRHYIELTGAKGNSTPAPKHTASRGSSFLAKPADIPAMPLQVSDAWREGLDSAQAHPTIVKRLAEWRGWNEPFAQYLIDCAAISMPLYYNERGLAFQVILPTGERGSMTTLPIGYHIRIKPDSPEKRASWRYVPNEQAHGHGIPALPYFLGDFEQATLLVITEGQWDALTFCLAAEWLGPDCLWPRGVGVIGIRGANGINPFLQYYRKFWPVNINCLLLPDGDGPGGKWFDGTDTFADRLSDLCRKVAVVKCGPEKDFNDSYRVQKITAGQISELLESHGMGLERPVLL